MSTSASQSELSALHAVLAQTLADAITNGVLTLDKDGNKVTIPAGANILNVARQFLKDNNIQATEASTGVKNLVAALPDFTEESPYP